jgi:hypothetical protein
LHRGQFRTKKKTTRFWPGMRRRGQHFSCAQNWLCTRKTVRQVGGELDRALARGGRATPRRFRREESGS